MRSVIYSTGKKLAAANSRFSRKIVTVAPLDKLEEVTKREIYRDHIIGQEIRDARDDKFIELRYPGGEEYLRPSQAYGDVDALAVQRQMIHRTIKEHLDKEKRLRPQGIKVLSLFFIDTVEKYRQYDADGNSIKGDYARIFEEEYRSLAKYPDYQSSPTPPYARVGITRTFFKSVHCEKWLPNNSAAKPLGVVCVSA